MRLPEARTDVAVLVGEEWLSSARNDYNLSMNAEQTLMVFARSGPDFEGSRIWFARGTDAGWGRVAEVPFTDSRYRDSDPWLTPDGRTLYFVSNRPVAGERPNGSLDIWRAAYDGRSFGAPEHIAALASSGMELGPELHDGWLYFNSSRNDGPAKLSIYRARMRGDDFDPPQALGSPFNTGAYQGDFTLSPDGRMAMFWSERGSSKDEDLFVACRMETGWSDAVRLPAPINAPGMDFTPAFTTDGKLLYFASMRLDVMHPASNIMNGQANLYVISGETVKKAARQALSTAAPDLDCG